MDPKLVHHREVEAAVRSRRVHAQAKSLCNTRGARPILDGHRPEVYELTIESGDLASVEYVSSAPALRPKLRLLNLRYRFFSGKH